MGRRLFIDWCRGLAVLCMIEHHCFDAFMPASFHGTPLDGWLRLLGGVAAPGFLFLAGLSLVLMMEKQHQRGDARGPAAASGARRALVIVAAAYAFRLTEWALAFGGSPASSLLRIDVLNCISAALLLLALLWRAGGPLLLLAAAATALVTPLVWHADLSRWPRHLAGYLNGRPPDAFFPLFPWMAFAFAGGFVGLLVARVRAQDKLFAGLFAGAAALFFATRALDALPFRLYPKVDWWVDSPACFVNRLCLQLGLLCACYFIERAARPLWERLPAGPLVTLGRHSLLVYWVHVELVYGRLTWQWRGNLTLQQAAAAFAMVTLAMVALASAIDPARRRLATFNFQLSNRSS